MTRPPRLEESVVRGWSSEHPAWRLDEGHLVRELATVDYPSAVAIASAQVTIAEGMDHHPILTVGYRRLRVELWTHDAGGITSLDLAYAEAFDDMVGARFGDVVAG